MKRRSEWDNSINSLTVYNDNHPKQISKQKYGPYTDVD